jgi:hypothetical protein
MKNLTSILLMSFFLILTNYSIALKFKYQKISTDVKKESKKYEKEGWNNFPGSMPIGQQLNNTFNKQNELDEEGMQKWFFATGISVAQTIAAAEMQANELAKIDLVKQVESDIKSFTETNLANNQLSKDEAASITKTVNVVTNKVAQKLGRVIPLLRIYKETPNNYEVQVQVGYNIASAKKIMIEEVKKELGDDADKIKEKMSSFLYSEKKN